MAILIKIQIEIQQKINSHTKKPEINRAFFVFKVKNPFS